MELKEIQKEIFDKYNGEKGNINTNNSDYNDDNKNCIFGAFVLFPYNNEDEFRNHKFYK